MSSPTPTPTRDVVTKKGGKSEKQFFPEIEEEVKEASVVDVGVGVGVGRRVTIVRLRRRLRHLTTAKKCCCQSFLVLAYFYFYFQNSSSSTSASASASAPSNGTRAAFKLSKSAVPGSFDDRTIFRTTSFEPNFANGFAFLIS